MVWHGMLRYYVMLWYGMMSDVTLCYDMVCYDMICYLMLGYGMVWYGMDCMYECMYAWKYSCKMGEARETFSRNLESHIMQDSPQSTVDTVDTERAVLQDQASRRTTCQQLLPQSSLTRQTVCSRKWSAVCCVAHILCSRPVTHVQRL